MKKKQPKTKPYEEMTRKERVIHTLREESMIGRFILWLQGNKSENEVCN